MPQGTTSNAAELRHAFRDEITDYIVEKYAKFANFIGTVKQEGSDIGDGLYWEVPLRSGWNVGVTSEGGVFPTPRTNTSINPYVKLGQLVGAFSYTMMLEEVGKGRGAWVDVTKRGSKDVMRDIVSLADRYMAGGSGDGALGTVAATTSTSTSFVLDLPFGGLLIEEGMPLQIHDGSSTEREDYTVVTKYVPSTRTVTVDASQNLTAGDKVYFSLGTSGGTQGLTTHINGLGNLVSDSGTVHNINRSTYELWKANVFSNGGELRNYSDSIVHSALLQTETRSKADARIDHLISNKGQILKFNESLRSDRRVAVGGSGLSDMGTGVSLKPSFRYGDREIPWLEFSHIKPRTIYGIVKKNFKRLGKPRPTFMDGFELGLTNGVRNTSKEIYCVWLTQLFCDKFNDMFAISDLSDPALCGADVNGSDT